MIVQKKSSPPPPLVAFQPSPHYIACMSDKPTSTTWEVLQRLMDSGVAPEKLDETHDLLRLLGVVLGQIALLDIATDDSAKDSARVAAARALMDLHESPESIAERIRRSPFSDLTAAQLQVILDSVKNGETDLQAIVSRVKKDEPHAPLSGEGSP